MAFRPDKLTVKAQEAIQAAQQIAESQGHAQLVPLHLLKALLDEQGGIVRPLMEKVGIRVPQLLGIVDASSRQSDRASRRNEGLVRFDRTSVDCPDASR